MRNFLEGAWLRMFCVSALLCSCEPQSLCLNCTRCRHMRAASSTVLAICPLTDSPKFGSSNPGPQGTRPKVGFIPTSPQCAAGRRIEPPASVPKASAPMPAATALTAPPEDPPGVRSRSQGERVLPYTKLFEIPLHANSEQFVMPIITAPSSLSLATAHAS